MLKRDTSPPFITVISFIIAQSWIMAMTLLVKYFNCILTEDGYITLGGTSPIYYYFLKDYLGNVRVVMNEDGKTVEQSNNYYPFGGIFNSKGDGEQPYKFNGKELETMHGLNWYDYGARMKDDWFFPTPDPLKLL